MRMHWLHRSRHTVEHVQPRPLLPTEVWQEVAQYLSLRELENTAFLHPALEASGRAKKPVTITLPASGGAPSDSSRLVEDELIEARQRHVESHVRSLRLFFNNIPARNKQVPDMKSLFQGLRHLSSRVHRNPTLDFLRGFENITELLLEPREPLFHTPFTWHGLPYPHVMETWRVVGPRLTTLNITLRHGFEGIINVLPPSHAISEPLPLLECMILEILLISPKPPYEISAEQKRRDTVVQVMHRISALYLGSRKLQELSLKSYNKRESDGFDTELLSILLPSSQGQVHYPALTRFRICLPLYDQIPTWDGPLMEFLSVHSTRLKMLQLRTANGETVKRWLGFNFPVLDKLEIDILREDVIGFRKLSEKFPSLVQNSLTALTIGVLGSNSELRNLVENIGSLAPHLDTLRIGGGFRLWPEFFFTLSIELPELYSLMVEVSRLEADSGQGFMSCPNFLREVVCHLPRKEALNAWKLFDIGVRSDVLKFEEVAVLMNGLAELIPSVQSFFMHGYTMDV